MTTHEEKNPIDSNQSENKKSLQQQANGTPSFHFEDNRLEAVVQNKLQDIADSSIQVSQLKTYQDMANNSPIDNKLNQYQSIADNYLTDFSNSASIQRVVMNINGEDPNVAANTEKYMNSHPEEELAGTMIYKDGKLSGVVSNKDAAIPEVLKIIGHGGHLDSLVSEDLEDINASSIAEGINPSETGYSKIELIACRSKGLAKKLAMILPDVPVTGYDGSVIIRGGKPTVYDHDKMEAVPDEEAKYTYIRRGDEVTFTKG
ncbi:hypothetical protein OA501_01780 [Flavobacteriaceae bacterium]|nr:hypothetical protein [Flavobacteriaceae bacterium]